MLEAVDRSHKVLIVEDDARITEMIRFTLEPKGYRCCGVENSNDFFAKLESEDWSRPDIVLMDVMLPGKNGFEICQELKSDERFASIPVVMLSARGEEEDLLRGYGVGVEDYLTKPFSPRVLMAKLNKLVAKQTASTLQAPCDFGLISVSALEKKVWVDKKRIDLTKTEFEVLSLFLARPEQVLERQDIVNAIHGNNFHVTSRSVDFLMVGLRKKLGPAKHYIQTVRGVGYRLSSEG